MVYASARAMTAVAILPAVACGGSPTSAMSQLTNGDGSSLPTREPADDRESAQTRMAREVDRAGIVDHPFGIPDANLR